MGTNGVGGKPWGWDKLGVGTNRGPSEQVLRRGGGLSVGESNRYVGEARKCLARARIWALRSLKF